MGRDVGIGYTGATLYFVALIILVLGVLVMIASPICGLGLLVLGGIIGVVSSILIGVGFYKVGEIYNESTTKIGGILAAIPIGIISFVGYIIVYVGLGKIKPMPTIQPQIPLSQPSYPPQIYQVGQGIIRGDGNARVSLYSATQATVLSARIEGTTLASANINPAVLQPGQNEITIKFDNVSSLTPGGSYMITIVVNVGGNISEIKANAIYQP